MAILDQVHMILIQKIIQVLKGIFFKKKKLIYKKKYYF